MAISQLYPAEGPTLNLNFAGSRTLDPRITFTRTSSATFMGRDGLVKIAPANSARFDHRYVNGEVESLGLLVEESRTNLINYSNDLSTWGSVYSQTLTKDVVGPDGVTNSAWTFNDTYTGSDGAFREKSFSVTPSTNQYCFSVFAKSGTAIWFDMYAFFIGSSIRAVYLNYVWATNTLSVGSAENSPPVPTVYGRIEYPNGWYRFYFVFSDPTGLNNTCLFRLYPSSRNAEYVGSTLFYGAQLEVGAFPTSYIPTEGSTATRTVDVVSMTGTNFSSWFNQTEGTIFANFMGKTIRSSLTYDRYIAIVGNDPNLDEMGFYTQTAGGGGVYKKIGGVITNNAVDQIPGFISGGGGPDFGGKAILAYKSNDASYTINGATPVTDNTVDLPIFVELRIFGRARYQLEPSGHISQFIYYPRRLTNAQLQTLTR